jgi:co-chaperonin GroES (HSP10)
MNKNKPKLVSSCGDVLCPDVSAVTICKVPKVKGVKPTGSQLLIEILTPQELTSSTIHIASSGNDSKVPLQGYIVAMGPSVKNVDWGFKVGDRVLISGFGVMAPKYDDSNRDRFLMDPSVVKCVLEEAE